MLVDEMTGSVVLSIDIIWFMVAVLPTVVIVSLVFDTVGDSKLEVEVVGNRVVIFLEGWLVIFVENAVVTNVGASVVDVANVEEFNVAVEVDVAVV